MSFGPEALASRLPNHSKAGPGCFEGFRPILCFWSFFFFGGGEGGVKGGRELRVHLLFVGLV